MAAVPFYIPNECETCGGPLVLKDVQDGVTDADQIWTDEWCCPEHGGCYLDLSPAEIEELRAAVKSVGGPTGEPSRRGVDDASKHAYQAAVRSHFLKTQTGR